MSFMDNVLNFLHLNDEDDDDYEFANEEYLNDEEYEEPKKKSPRRENRVEVKEKTVPKITPISKAQKKNVTNLGMEVCVIKPISVEDEREIVDTLLSGRTVLINMEGLNIDIAQRIIDFTSGATYAMQGGLQKVSTYIFLATPNGVEISGDIQNFMDDFGIDNNLTY